MGEEITLCPRMEDTRYIDIGVRQMDVIREVNLFQ